ncbi:MFS transporter [Aquihabitans sp. G128]|uniref:MFS transporter n=1 Tax=Aquihabitans sp. G128 TaxID=2849779 RepID=UPI001C212993|nr:MFS transporter [Aquihabitans sp. G128]QXC62352.1 MFS transporter [Aquihabitans sp. G128]
MAVDLQAPPPPRAARAAVAALFFTNGALFASAVPRYPEIKADLGLSNGALGAAIAAFPLGALLLGLTATALVGRFRSRRVAVVGILVLGAVLALVPFAPRWGLLAAVLFVAGGIDAVVDVAQNAHGLRVQRRYGRSIVNALHGLWSVGAVVGGLVGAALAGLEVPLPAHFIGAAVVAGAIALVADRHLLPGPDDRERVPGLEAADASADASGTEPASPPDASADAPAIGAEKRPDASADASGGDIEASPAVVAGGLRTADRAVLLGLLALGLLAACGASVEDAGSSWGAVYLRDERGASAAVAGLAFVALQSAMTVGRLTGDRLMDRFGQRAVVRTGGLVAAIGMGAALLVPTTATTLLGYVAAGLGVATLIPAAMHAADELPGLPAGLGLTVVSWMLRVGFLLSAPLVGAVADATSIRVGLASVVLTGVAIVALSRTLARRPAASSAPASAVA